MKSIRMKRILSIAILAFTTLACGAYEMPTGVPAPWVSPDIERPARPSDWSTERAGYYYINYELGSDGSNFGTPISPRKTIPNPIPPGSYVEVHGKYNFRTAGDIRLTGAGNGKEWVANVSGPAWVVGVSADDPIQFTDYKVLLLGSYVFLENFYIPNNKLQIGSANTDTQYAADHILVRNGEVTGKKDDRSSALVSINAAKTHPASYFTIYKIKAHDTGDVNSSTDDDAGIAVTGDYVSHAWWLNNVFHTSSGSGVQVNPNPADKSRWDQTHHIYFARNDVYNTRQSGLWVKWGSDIVFSENTVHDIIDTSWSPSKGIGAQYKPMRVWIVNNTIYNSRYGVRIASTDSAAQWEIYVVGNVIYNIHNLSGSYPDTGTWSEACIHLQGGHYRYIENNTLDNCDSGIAFSGSAGKNVIRNNIITNISEPLGSHLVFGATTTDNVLTTNLFNQDDGYIRVGWGGAGQISLNDFMKNTGLCSNCISDDPKYANAGSGDFHIGNNDIIRINGTRPDSFGKYEEYYDGLSIDRDIDGNSRLSDGNIVLGAFEMKLLSGKSSPSPPILNEPQ